MGKFKMKIFILLIIIAVHICCNSSNRDRVIIIQPLGKFPKHEATLVFNEVQKANSNVILRPNIPFPKSAFYELRNRYRADSLIRILSRHTGQDSIIIGLSDADISTTKDKVEDWGVMGLSYRPGNACVVSTYRLSKKNKAEQFYKVALHELGHTEGLDHCIVKTCLMRDAEGGNPLDELYAFCPLCTKHLKAKNWKIH